jgi:hypothetical protein
VLEVRKENNGMSKKNFYYAVLAVGITAALTVAVTVKLSLFRAVPPVSPAPDASLQARATSVDESPGAHKEGIKVHGHWTIDVRNPDGTLVTHREFENALELTGARATARMFARQLSPGVWEIEVANFPLAAGGPCVIDSVPRPCWIAEATSPFPNSPTYFKTLTLTVTPMGEQNADALVLSGTATASNASQINFVRTIMRICAPTTPTATCLGDGVNEYNMTRADLATPINVVATQIIQVTVVISFS